MMRRVLLDHARKRAAVKRQGDLKRVPFEETLLPDISSKPVDIVMLNDLMARLAELNPRHARVFELRCFGGLNVKETAVVLDVSEATVKNDWRFARAWLASQLGSEQDE
jgi:RNA polymerase sigma-70 factor, ECF subfamily